MEWPTNIKMGDIEPLANGDSNRGWRAHLKEMPNKDRHMINLGNPPRKTGIVSGTFSGSSNLHTCGEPVLKFSCCTSDLQKQIGAANIPDGVNLMNLYCWFTNHPFITVSLPHSYSFILIIINHHIWKVLTCLYMFPICFMKITSPKTEIPTAPLQKSTMIQRPSRKLI